MALETWKAVVGWERLYEVSDLGRIRSLPRVVRIGNRWGGVTENLRPTRVLKPVRCPNGYAVVTLCDAELGRRERSLIHRIVLSAFAPTEDAHLLQGNHRNGVRDDNRLSNLEWVTCSDNHKHAYASLPRKKHGKAKPCVLRRGDLIAEFEDMSKAAAWIGTTPGSVASAALRGHLVRGYEVLA